MSRFKAAANAALCAAALSLAMFAEGCVRNSSVPAGGEAAAPAQATPGSPTLAQTTQPTPAPTTTPESPLPPPQGFVNDFADVIGAETKMRLEARLTLLKEHARIEFVVVTVETTGAEDIFDYSLAVAKGWGLGPPAGEEGGGVLLLLATKDRGWRVQVSRSLEADIPNEVAAEIGNRMTDALRAGRYGAALTTCVNGIVRRLAERRGLPMKYFGTDIQTSPEAKPTPARQRKP